MNSTTNKALYRQVAEEFCEKLSSGQLKVGDRLPTEAEYAAALGVSRSTIRLAFSMLESAGIIKRRKRGGTEIIAAKPVQRFDMTMPGTNSVLNNTRGTSFDLTKVQTVTTGDFNQLESYASQSANWLHCIGTRTMEGDNSPFAWSQVFVSEQYSSIGLKVGDSPKSIYAFIEQEYGWPLSRIKQRYSGGVCDAEMAQILGLKVGDPVTTGFVELFNAKDELILIANSNYDPKRFKIATDVNVANTNMG